MDFDQAIAAHGSWKVKLRDYLSKRDGSLKAAEISQDNKCPLGQWIYGEGSKYANLAEFVKLKSEHAHFHKITADIVRKADSGQTVSADVAVGSKSEFAGASSSVVMAILGMKKHAGQ